MIVSIIFMYIDLQKRYLLYKGHPTIKLKINTTFFMKAYNNDQSWLIKNKQSAISYNHSFLKLALSFKEKQKII